MSLVESADEVYIKRNETLSNRQLRHRSQLSGSPVPRIGLYLGLVSFLISVVFCGVLNLRDQTNRFYLNALQNYRWMVLVQGSPIEIDEIGRSLKQLDGVSEVTFISAGQAYETLKNDPLIQDHLANLDNEFILPAWQVQWSESGFSPERQNDLIIDTMRTSGVVDIGFDDKALGVVREARLFWLDVSLLIGIVSLGFLIFFLFVTGRFLFFTPVERWNPKTFFKVIGITTIGWLAGFGMIVFIMGAVPLWGALAGVLLGAAFSMVQGSVR